MLIKLPCNGPLDGWVNASQIQWLGFEETDDQKFWPMIQMVTMPVPAHLTHAPLGIDAARSVIDRIARFANAQ